MRQHVENLHIYTVLLSPCVMPQCTSDVNGVMRATFTSIKMISLIKPITSIKTNSHISKNQLKPILYILLTQHKSTTEDTQPINAKLYLKNSFGLYLD